MSTRSSRLLGSFLDSGEMTEEDLARELVVSPDEVRKYRNGETVMPLSRQLVLAKLVIARSISLRRQGHALQAQVVAATGFHNKDVERHAGGSTTWKKR
jgi:hypothetical protein